MRRAAYRQQQADNRALASERVVCEHALRAIGHQVYCNRQEDVDDRSMVTAAGLWKFYLEAAQAESTKIARSSQQLSDYSLFHHNSTEVNEGAGSIANAAAGDGFKRRW
ncbi:MAG: hypothetical protein AAF609_04310 [Cyanobacteria bacterium P01_C01_bin.120]